MTIDIAKYTLSLDNLDHSKILSSWKWLIDDKTIVALTKAGDMLLKDEKNHLYFLDIGNGTIKPKANDYWDFFNEKLNAEVIQEILFPILIDKLENQNITLKPGQVYSYKTLPILGGGYDEKNMFALDIYEHYGLSGDIHFQIKDLPNGTDIEFVTEK